MRSKVMDEVIRVQLVSLIARRDKAREFILNSKMIQESELLDAQIKALYEEQRNNKNRRDPSKEKF